MNRIDQTKPSPGGRRSFPGLLAGAVFRLDGDLRRVVRRLPAAAGPDSDVLVTLSVRTCAGSRRYPLLALQARDVEAALGSARVAHEDGMVRQAPTPRGVRSTVALDGERPLRLDPG